MKFLLSSIKVICAMTLLSVLSSCATPVWNYKEPKNFYINVSPENNALKEEIEKLGGKNIQNTFTLPG